MEAKNKTITKKERLNLFLNAYEKMAPVFTSHEFAWELRSLGYEIGSSDFHLKFLKRNATQDGHRSRTWTKKKNETLFEPANETKIGSSTLGTVSSTISHEPIESAIEAKPVKDLQTEIEEAINLLKVNGYRIMKIEWTEI